MSSDQIVSNPIILANLKTALGLDTDVFFETPELTITNVGTTNVTADIASFTVYGIPAISAIDINGVIGDAPYYLDVNTMSGFTGSNQNQLTSTTTLVIKNTSGHNVIISLRGEGSTQGASMYEVYELGISNPVTLNDGYKVILYRVLFGINGDSDTPSVWEAGTPMAN